MKRPLVIGNWKMNKSIVESVDMIHQLRNDPNNIDRIDNVDIILTPSYLALYAVREACVGSVIKLGGQDAYYRQTGAYSGAISPRMLSEVCEYAFVGHSERRIHFGDKDETVNKRLLACLEVGITPVLCLGESREVFEQGGTKQYILAQLEKGLKDAPLPNDIVILYEPVWALGTGVLPEPDQVDSVMRILQEAAQRLYGQEVFAKMRFVYAGSINPENVAQYATLPMVDGLALGTASLDIDSLYRIINIISKLYIKG